VFFDLSAILQLGESGQNDDRLLFLGDFPDTLFGSNRVESLPNKWAAAVFRQLAVWYFFLGAAGLSV